MIRMEDGVPFHASCIGPLALEAGLGNTVKVGSVERLRCRLKPTFSTIREPPDSFLSSDTVVESVEAD